MRSALGVFGLCAAITTTLLVAIVNFRSSGGWLESLIMAFYSGVIAIMGLGFPAFALYLWKYSKFTSVVLWGFATCGAIFSILWDNLGTVAWVLGAKVYLPLEVAFAGSAFVHLAIPMCLVSWVTIRRGEGRDVPEEKGVREARSKPAGEENENSSAHDPINSIVRTMTLLLEPARGKRVDLAAVYARYQADVLRQGRLPECQSVFEEAVGALCDATALKVQIANRKVYLSGCELSNLRA